MTEDVQAYILTSQHMWASDVLQKLVKQISDSDTLLSFQDKIIYLLHQFPLVSAGQRSHQGCVHSSPMIPDSTPRVHGRVRTRMPSDLCPL